MSQTDNPLAVRDYDNPGFTTNGLDKLQSTTTRIDFPSGLGGGIEGLLSLTNIGRFAGTGIRPGPACPMFLAQFAHSAQNRDVQCTNWSNSNSIGELSILLSGQFF